ncbi:hypothetical protein LY76DRAFT_402285 [Colletotrichum caudatum]|nr:hypothetical protein LY76DRAFT_402285 [Colletotrichum caudatum]
MSPPPTEIPKLPYTLPLGVGKMSWVGRKFSSHFLQHPLKDHDLDMYAVRLIRKKKKRKIPSPPPYASSTQPSSSFSLTQTPGLAKERRLFKIVIIKRYCSRNWMMPPSRVSLTENPLESSLQALHPLLFAAYAQLVLLAMVSNAKKKQKKTGIQLCHSACCL